MARPTESQREARYNAIRTIIQEHENEVYREDGSYDFVVIMRYLKLEHNMTVSQRRLYDILTEGRINRMPSKPAEIDIDIKKVVEDFKDALEILRKIIKSKSSDQKEKLEAMRVLRPLEKDLVDLVDKINKAEIEKAALSKPVLVVKFGNPVVVSKEQLAKKVKEDEETVS